MVSGSKPAKFDSKLPEIESTFSPKIPYFDDFRGGVRPTRPLLIRRLKAIRGCVIANFCKQSTTLQLHEGTPQK